MLDSGTPYLVVYEDAASRLQATANIKDEKEVRTSIESRKSGGSGLIRLKSEIPSSAMSGGTWPRGFQAIRKTGFCRCLFSIQFMSTTRRIS